MGISPLCDLTWYVSSCNSEAGCKLLYTERSPFYHYPVDVLMQLLIGYETGLAVLWDLREKTAEFRYNSPEVCMRSTIQNVVTTLFKLSASLRLNSFRPNLSETESSTFFCSQFVKDLVTDLLDLSLHDEIDLAGRGLFQQKSQIWSQTRKVRGLACEFVESMVENLFLSRF